MTPWWTLGLQQAPRAPPSYNLEVRDRQHKFSSNSISVGPHLKLEAHTALSLKPKNSTENSIILIKRITYNTFIRRHSDFGFFAQKHWTHIQQIHWLQVLLLGGMFPPPLIILGLHLDKDHSGLRLRSFKSQNHRDNQNLHKGKQELESVPSQLVGQGLRT